MHRIAFRTLFHDRIRAAAAIAGVAVATMLMLVQMGIHAGFAQVASAPIRRIGGDVWVMSHETEHVDHGGILHPGADRLLRQDPCVRRVRPVIIRWTPYRRADGSAGMVQLFGVNGSFGSAVPWDVQRGIVSDLDVLGRVSVDTHDASIVGVGDPMGAPIDIAGHRGFVGLVTRGLRADFGMHPRVFASVETAQEILNLHSGEVTYWVADLRSPSCSAVLIGSLGSDARLRVLTASEFAASTERQLLEKSGVGVALGFIAILGAIVAAAVVGQTLLASLRQHRRELAMLKAIGATPIELSLFVTYQAAALGGIGALLGVGATAALKSVLDGLAVPVLVRPQTSLIGFCAIALISMVASLGSLRAVWRIEADEVLR